MAEVIAALKSVRMSSTAGATAAAAAVIARHGSSATSSSGAAASSNVDGTPPPDASRAAPATGGAVQFEAALRALENSDYFNDPDVAERNESSVRVPSLMQRRSWRGAPVFSSELSGTGATSLAKLRGLADTNEWLRADMAAYRETQTARLQEERDRQGRYRMLIENLTRELIASSVVSRATELGVEEAADVMAHARLEALDARPSPTNRERRAEEGQLLADKSTARKSKLTALQEQALFQLTAALDGKGKRRSMWMRASKLQGESDRLQSEVDKALAEERRVIEAELNVLKMQERHQASVGIVMALKRWRRKTNVSVQQRKQKAKENRIRERMAALQAEFDHESAEADRQAADHVAEIRRKREAAAAAALEATERKLRTFREACDLKDAAYFEVGDKRAGSAKSNHQTSESLVKLVADREQRRSDAINMRGSLMAHTYKHSEIGQDAHMPAKLTARESRGLTPQEARIPEPPEMDPRGLFLHSIEHHEPGSCVKRSADEDKYFALSTKRLQAVIADEQRCHRGGWSRPHVLLICDAWEGLPGIRMSEEAQAMLDAACVHHDTEGAPVVYIRYNWDIKPKQLLTKIRNALHKEARRQKAEHAGKIHSLALMVNTNEGSIFMTKQQLTSISSLTVMEKSNREDQHFWLEIDKMLTVCKDPATSTEPDRSGIGIHLICNQNDFNQSKQGRGLQVVLSAMMQCEVAEVIIPYDKDATEQYFDVSKISRVLEFYDREKRIHRGLEFENGPAGQNLADVTTSEENAARRKETLVFRHDQSQTAERAKRIVTTIKDVILEEDTLLHRHSSIAGLVPNESQPEQPEPDRKLTMAFPTFD